MHDIKFIITCPSYCGILQFKWPSSRFCPDVHLFSIIIIVHPLAGKLAAFCSSGLSWWHCPGAKWLKANWCDLALHLLLLLLQFRELRQSACSSWFSFSSSSSTGVSWLFEILRSLSSKNASSLQFSFRQILLLKRTAFTLSVCSRECEHFTNFLHSKYDSLHSKYDSLQTPIGLSLDSLWAKASCSQYLSQQVTHTFAARLCISQDVARTSLYHSQPKTPVPKEFLDFSQCVYEPQSPLS